jgi:pimeloyl-ACP methyl ester carboxylesterase
MINRPHHCPSPGNGQPRIYFGFAGMTICLMLLAPAWSAAGRASPLRVACIGSGMTHLTGAAISMSESYPRKLQMLLGGSYEVGEFGSNDAALSLSAPHPYLLQPACAAALQFLPDIVFVELGTYDCRRREGVTADSLCADCSRLIGRFLSLPSKPRLLLLLPPPLFARDTAGYSNDVLIHIVVPALQMSAYANDVEIISLQSYFLGHGDLFPDGITPSSEGAAMIARRLQEALDTGQTPGFDVFAGSRVPAIRTNYYGFESYDFAFARRDAKIVKPKRAAKGHPWIWRARFWGHEPQTEIALLERGFHLVYCDVSELFGNPEALHIWDRFYEFLSRQGLSRKTAMIGFSRGGFYAYRWAAANPDRIACVYADAPVLDMKSWPGGKGKGGGNPVEWDRFKQDFNFTSEEEALGFTGNPLDMAGRIAAAGFPMLHICGSADPVVPIEENTDIFEKNIIAAGGRITVIRKPGAGHHPHSLPNPAPIVDFILRATTQR